MGLIIIIIIALIIIIREFGQNLKESQIIFGSTPEGSPGIP